MNLLQFPIFVFLFYFIELTLNPPEGIIAGPINEDNFFEWEALIMWVNEVCVCAGFRTFASEFRKL